MLRLPCRQASCTDELSCVAGTAPLEFEQGSLVWAPDVLCRCSIRKLTHHDAQASVRLLYSNCHVTKPAAQLQSQLCRWHCASAV